MADIPKTFTDKPVTRAGTPHGDWSPFLLLCKEHFKTQMLRWEKSLRKGPCSMIHYLVKPPLN